MNNNLFHYEWYPTHNFSSSVFVCVYVHVCVRTHPYPSFPQAVNAAEQIPLTESH